MHIWSALAAREVALLVMLLLLGSGPAAFLPARFDAVMRIALAPLLGFCVGTCITTTILWFAPVNDTYWVLIPLSLGSAAVALVRIRRRRTAGEQPSLPRLRDVAALLLVAVAVTLPTTVALHHRHTVGPAAFVYTDGDNYVAVQDAARTVSLHSARDAWQHFLLTQRRFKNQSQFTWAYIADVGSNLDATPLDANLNALLGLGAADTFSPFLLVLLLMGAGGAFAAVRYFARSSTWAAALGGCLFGGPLFLELWFDTYQAAIIAIGLVVPFVMLVYEAMREDRRATLALLALLLGTVLTVYPLYVVILLATVGLIIAVKGALQLRAGVAWRPLVRPVALRVAAVAVLAIVFDPVAFLRDVHYFPLVLNGTLSLPRVGYSLPLDVLPGWIAQTRDFWGLAGLGHGGAKQILLGVVLPLLFLGFAGYGLIRHRMAWPLVGLGAVFAVVAEYAYLSQHSCTYCAERNLLPLGPIAAVLVSIGLAGLLRAHVRWVRVIGALGIAIVFVAVGQRARIELQRFSESSYFMDSENRDALGGLPRGRGSVLVEGYGASFAAQAEQPLVYHLVNERSAGRASIVLGSNLGNAISYLDFGAILTPGPQLDPRFRFVLTRLGSVATDRRVIRRSGSIALEERVKPLDVTPYAGLGLGLLRIDPSGTAWVQTQYPLQLYVLGSDGGRPAWARLVFRTSVPVVVPRQAAVRSRLVGQTLTVCVPARGQEPFRQATLHINAQLHNAPIPHALFPPSMPFEGLALTAMRAVSGSCRA
jgi:hypothetical protein